MLWALYAMQARHRPLVPFHRAGRGVRGYAIAVASVALALALTLLLWPVLHRNPTPLFFAAVMVAVWVSGLGPGLAAAFLSALTVEYFLVEPFYAVLVNLEAAARLAIFAVVAVLIDSLVTARRQAEAERRETDVTLQAVAQASPVAIVALDADDRVCMWSAGAERVFGWSAFEVMGRPNPIVLDRADGETRCRRRDGNLVDVSVWSAPLAPGHGPRRRLLLLADVSTRKHAEAERERLLRERVALLESTGQGVFGLDADGRCTFINRAGANMLGYMTTEVIGSRLHDLIRARRRDDAPLAREESPVDRALRAGIASDSDDEVVWRRDGSSFPAHYACAPIIAGGVIEGAVVTFTDITERKRAEVGRMHLLAQAQGARAEAEAGERRAAFLARASAKLAGSLDYETALTRVARMAVGEIADWCAVDVRGEGGSLHHVVLAHVDEARERAARALLATVPAGENANHPMARVIRTGKPALHAEVSDADLALIASDPQQLVFLRSLGLVSAVVVPLVARRKVLGALTLATDVSGRRYDDADLAVAEQLARRAALAIDNARLYREARAAREDAEVANRAKDHFLAILSHELRTPLNAMVGWVRLLQTGKLDGPGARRALDTIDRNMKLQAKLIEDLLDVSAIIAGKAQLDVRPVDVGPAVTALVEGFRPAAEAKSIHLETVLVAGGVVVADPARLHQMLSNLVSNAIKFTPDNGRIVVTLERRGGNAAIIVSDTGVGIRAESLPLVFDRFRQAETGSRRTPGGLGLGLAIVRHLTALHGGTVDADSAGPGRGATFTITLPLIAAVDAAPSPARGTVTTAVAFDCPPLLRGLRVLVVDDEPDARELIAEVLEQCNAAVSSAASVREALAEVERLRPHVVLSDIGMPGEDGYDLIRELRAREKEGGRRTPALAVTAFASPEDRQRALSAGYDLHLPKPVDPPELVEVVAKLAGRARVA
ncbi:MAG TPA: ATP-binding protein [Methylomirabilota bacterium]|jgi:PAS domain S-box-containing protein